MSRRIEVRCVRGTLAPALSRVVSSVACGDLAEQVSNVLDVFAEVENLLDRASNRTLDIAGEPDSGLDPAIVKLDDSIWVADVPSALGHPRVAPAFAATLDDVGARAFRQFRTLSMSLLIAVDRACNELDKAIAAADETAERDAAASVHADVLRIADQAAFGDDPRHPFEKLWPKLVAVGFVNVAAVPFRHHAAQAR